MDPRRLLATLAQQIDITRYRADLDQGRSDLSLALFHSLRVTYLAISTGLDPRKDAGHLFLLTVSGSGEHLLLQGGQPVPVNSPYLASLFWSVGIELLPGQILLLESEIAKDAVQEALGGLALEQALADRDLCRRREALDHALALRVAEERSNLLWDRKIELVAASLVADEYLERARALLGPDEPESDVEAA